MQIIYKVTEGERKQIIFFAKKAWRFLAATLNVIEFE